MIGTCTCVFPPGPAGDTHSQWAYMSRSSKKRLLFFLHSLSLGGAERIVFQMCNELVQDYQVGICCLDSRGKLWSEAEQLGLELYLLQRRPGWHWQTFSQARDVIDDFKPDIVHAHQYTPYLYAAAAKFLSRSSPKLIFTEHGRHYPDRVGPGRRLVSGLLLSVTNSLTGVSEFTCRALMENEGFRSRDIRVIYNGLYKEVVEDCSIREEFGISLETKVIGFVGSLRAVKNPDFLLKALSRVVKDIDDVALILLGDGPLRKELEYQALELGVGRKTFFAGARTKVTPYLSSLDAFVLPSLSEACSLALLEAMYAGAPVVVSNRGGNPELVIDGESGWLIECDDVNSLANALVEVLSDSCEVARRVELAKQRVENKFSFSKMLEEYKTLYN